MSESKKRKQHYKLSEIATEPKLLKTETKSNKFTLYGLLLAVFAFLLYSATISHEFVLDDGLVTSINTYVKKGMGGLWDIFSHAYRAGATITTNSDYVYRPLSVMMFAMEWNFFPDNPKVHHIINVLFYAISIYFVFKLLLKLLGDNNLPVIIITCLLFTVHPLHTEVVSNIKSRDEIMCFLFSVLTIIFVLRASENKPWSLPLACISFLLSLLSKEGAVITLAIIPLTLYFFNKGNFIKPTLFLALVFVGWFILRKSIIGNPVYDINSNDNQIVGLALGQRWATSFYVLWYYLKLSIWPWPLSWDYSFSHIKNYSWKELMPIFSLILHLGLFVFAIAKLKSRSIYSFCILAYIVSMALYSNLVLVIGTLMGERFTYQASLWFCLGVVMLIYSLLKHKDIDLHKNKKVIFYSAMGLISCIYAYITFQRTADWKDNFTLFSKDVLNAPNSFRTHQALGDESLQKFMKLYKNPSDSIKYIQLAEKHHSISSSISKNFSNQVGLGNALLIQNKYAEALPLFLSAQKFGDGNVIKERIRTTYYRHGISLARDSNNLEKAEELLVKAYSMDSTQVELMSDLGMVYGLKRNFYQALYYFNKAYEKKPNDPNIIANLANTYLFIGNKTKADELFSKIPK
ncbi:MAG: tetratricopeptide repeat protein [Saprospiraceae bacterium]|nr:tetratricopeptide repeat protein [Saprospiraceae bacterium]